MALKIAEMYEKTLSSILIGNNLVNIAISSIRSGAVHLLDGECRYLGFHRSGYDCCIDFWQNIAKDLCERTQRESALGCMWCAAGFYYGTDTGFVSVFKNAAWIYYLFKGEKKQPSVTEGRVKVYYRNH